MTEQEKLGKESDQTRSYNINEMMDDPELQNLHADRIAQLQTEHERRLQMQRKGHGQVTEINEGDFLEVVTKGEHVVVHFFHRDFERCKIMDKHLAVLAKKHFKTRFVRISAPVRTRSSLVCMRPSAVSAKTGSKYIPALGPHPYLLHLQCLRTPPSSPSS